MNKNELIKKIDILEKVFEEFLDKIDMDKDENETASIEISIESLKYTMFTFATNFPDNKIREEAKKILTEHFEYSEADLETLL